MGRGVPQAFKLEAVAHRKQKGPAIMPWGIGSEWRWGTHYLQSLTQGVLNHSLSAHSVWDSICTMTRILYKCLLCLSVIVYYTEDRSWMETALSFSVEHGLLDLLQYLVDIVGVTLTGVLY